MVDDWDSPEAFDDIPGPAKVQGESNQALYLSDRVMDCISTEIIRPQGHLKLFLKLVDVLTGEEAFYFINNAQQLKGGRVKVEKKSAIAKLYRLTHGFINQHRHHEFNQLIKHFIGQRFICTTQAATFRNGDHYLKVTSCKPESPIYDDDNYTRTGEIRQKTNRNLTKNRQKTNKIQTVATPQKPLKHSTSSHAPTNDKWLMVNELMINEPNPLLDDKEEEIERTAKSLKGMRPGETLDEYFERVIDETF
ncbi:MAG: hypothetical protein IBX55_18290 [Methyloprofundus sp.]|nr:hypothetical protein [Methyloprofundus sp.]